MEAITKAVKAKAKQPIIETEPECHSWRRLLGAGGAEPLMIDIERPFAIRRPFRSCCYPYGVSGKSSIGMGGILPEFILAGATAVSIGTANFTNPYTTVLLILYMRRHAWKIQ